MKNTSLLRRRFLALRPAALAAGWLLLAQMASPVAAQDSADLTPEIQALKDRIELEKQRNAIQAELLASQKALIDAQKASADSQAQWLGARKSIYDAAFPAITGGKAGSVSFEAETNIGALAQPGANEALNTLADTICAAVSPAQKQSELQEPAQQKPPQNKVILLATDGDLQMIAQSRWLALQVKGLLEGYRVNNADKPGDDKSGSKLGTTSLSAGMALYGVAAALKEVAGFTQLFRTDTTVYGATIKIDQDALDAAVSGCLAAQNYVTVVLPKSLLVRSLVTPAASDFLGTLDALQQYRARTDLELAGLAGKTDDGSKKRVAWLVALNARADALVAGLYATGDKVPEPQILSVLAGEAMLQKVGEGASVLQTVLSHAAASGMKRSSIWRSDRLYSWSSVTVTYSHFDSTGKILKAGSVQQSPGPQKIEIAP